MKPERRAVSPTVINLAGRPRHRRAIEARMPHRPRIRRHFHVIHNEARTLSASARAFIDLLESTPIQAGKSRGRAPRP